MSSSKVGRAGGGRGADSVHVRRTESVPLREDLIQEHPVLELAGRRVGTSTSRRSSERARSFEGRPKHARGCTPDGCGREHCSSCESSTSSRLAFPLCRLQALPPHLSPSFEPSLVARTHLVRLPNHQRPPALTTAPAGLVPPQPQGSSSLRCRRALELCEGASSGVGLATHRTTRRVPAGRSGCFSGGFRASCSQVRLLHQSGAFHADARANC